SYLQDRKVAYENLARRTGLEGVKSVCLALQQAERYGTPLGHSLRVMAQENRDMRMNEAEKKAAALPPKLTVPMILFFLPVLFSSFSDRLVSRSPSCTEAGADRTRSADGFQRGRSDDQSGWLSEATGVRFGAPRGASLRLSMSLR
ncbi:type II secretion system F family protein, partial [Pseudomonas fluorescens]|nr:type II secretion system F family protein [Pseudomonas fluorescens]